MHSPAAAMVWQLWWRYRGLALAGVAWYLTASIVCRLLPVNAYNDAIVFMSAVPMLLLLGCQVAVFTYGYEADLSTRESGYPSWMLRHPVSVRLLVGWPMFLGALTVALLWMAIAPAVFRSRGVDVLILRPALMCAAILAWSQALVWSPFGLGWLRVVAAVGAVAMVVSIAALDVTCGVRETVILALLAAQLPLAYWVAVVGVSRARRGDTPEWRWLPMVAQRVAAWIPQRNRGFGSALRAQAWFEWRRHGLGPPLAVGMSLPMGIAFIVANQMNSNVAEESPMSSPLLLLVLVAYMALGLGNDFGNLGATKADRGMPGFLLTRPISSADLIRAKYLAAAKSWLAICLITALAVVVCTILTGRYGDMNVLRDRLGYQAWWSHTAIAIPAVFLLLWTLGWLGVIQGLFIGLSGRQWVVFAVITVAGVLFCGLVLSGLWLSMHSEYHQVCWNAAPWVVGGLALLKLATAGWVLRLALTRGLLETRAVTLLVGVWMTVVLGMIGLTAWHLPSELVPPGLLAGGTILMFPLTRVALAPLALAWNRHR